MKNLSLSFFILLYSPVLIYGFNILNQNTSMNDTTLIFAEFCEGGAYEWNGVSYDQPGEYVNVFTDSSGIDSVVILTLEALETDTTQLVFEICSEEPTPLTGESIYNVNGDESYTVQFDEQIVLTNQYGCDSVVMAHNIVHAEVFTHGYATVHPGHIVNGEPLFESTEICWVDTTYFGCPDITCIVFYVLMNSIDELEKEIELQIYPNPVKASVNIDFVLPESLNIQVSLYDTTGKKLEELMGEKHMTGGTHKLNFDLSELPIGIYFLKLQIDGIGLMKKVIKI